MPLLKRFPAAWATGAAVRKNDPSFILIGVARTFRRATRTKAGKPSKMSVLLAELFCYFHSKLPGSPKSRFIRLPEGLKKLIGCYDKSQGVDLGLILFNKAG